MRIVSCLLLINGRRPKMHIVSIIVFVVTQFPRKCSHIHTLDTVVTRSSGEVLTDRVRSRRLLDSLPLGAVATALTQPDRACSQMSF